MNKACLLATGIILSGCASAGAADREISDNAAKRLAEFDRTGEVTNCINVRRINSITPLDEYHFLVRVGVSDYYLNEVSRCSGADSSFNRLQYEITTGSLCRNEIIRVIDNSSGFTVGSCGLGGFERLTEKVEDTEQ